MTTEITNFDEKDFKKFLEDKDFSYLYTFTIKEKEKDVTRKLTKVADYFENNPVILVSDIANTKFPYLSSLRLDKNIIPCGVFFAKLNAFIYEDKYKTNDAFVGLKGILSFSKKELLEKISDEAEQELGERTNRLSSLSNISTDAIEKMKVKQRAIVYRKMIRGEALSYLLTLDPLKFRREASYEMYYHYLANPTQYIREFVTNYIQQNPMAIKNQLARIAAEKELKRELILDERVRRAIKAFKLLHNQLKTVLNVTVVTVAGQRRTVPNEIEIYSNKVRVGSIHNNIEIGEIEAFEHQLKTYSILDDTM
ncbi:hypothetical protein [Priestia megaterium]|uniref:Uncharacterized protein n=1 Tax=Priestia megaterium TaxID=1404 RepID=A0A6M6E762_PRIMG|nr:hypothetical protein [Priestia megaterium]QJX80387.1 hypothetical protein FDZ14_30335 [Priestia megaterium]